RIRQAPVDGFRAIHTGILFADLARSTHPTFCSLPPCRMGVARHGVDKNINAERAEPIKQR
ncbi:MAG: hypothetical protein ACN6PV_13335, partial [Achromobacter sp.]|uniref:hypothetical protein n=1 Tax=Achromobacter sp. TaxID=134375 RepID=UPI003CFDCAEB